MNFWINSRATFISHTVLEYQTLTDDISHLPLNRRIWRRFEGHEDVESDKLGCHGAKISRIRTRRHKSNVQHKPWQRIGESKNRERSSQRVTAGIVSLDRKNHVCFILSLIVRGAILSIRKGLSRETWRSSNSSMAYNNHV